MLGIMELAKGAIPGIGELVGALAGVLGNAIKDKSGENEEKEPGKIAEDVHAKIDMQITYPPP
ncbi:hypothetical protein [Pseudomonas gessardii]|uniref:Uncharacterized protein n=1 Tax=Pseudomonas gessardii TaxID=78544 RepID=A0ABS9FBP7_9PSED|nr:hypothetical protein [Pseudomonas gessardii]MCF4980428.1 hypothetical protein [Pseudomonas gessardii]MCF4989152.1 hypothetical protein [Pseudomonas gessardii]MCF5084609.1 hypothetical protein [Pseudomonas gessardii]MCF5096072.1 hypothetical protein [Pseudomonas gessardii]MCF5109782.1 hypothetical protein [Pseudomonas gessardii]